MGLINWLHKITKPKTKKPNYEFTDEDRSLSEQARQDNAKLRRLDKKIQMTEKMLELRERKADLEDLEAELLGEEEDEDESPEITNWETLLFKILGNYLDKSGGNNGQAVSISGLSPVEKPPKVEAVTLTDEQILALLSQIPKSARKKLLKLDDDQLKALAKTQLPGASEESLERAIVLFRDM